MRNKKIAFNKIFAIIIISIGAGLIIASSFLISSFIAILGTATIFWGVILMYLLPVKHVPLTLLNASVGSEISNVERILNEFNFTEKGVYLPPKNLENINDSLVFVPKSRNIFLPLTAGKDYRQLYSENKDGIFLTPPGHGLSMFFEKEFGMTFLKTSVQDLPIILPKLLVEKLDLAQNLEVTVQENVIKILITDSVFSDVCKKTDNNPQSHEQVGCLLSSALACVLAKIVGKPLVVRSENTNLLDKTVSIDFLVLDN